MLHTFVALLNGLNAIHICIGFIWLCCLIKDAVQSYLLSNLYLIMGNHIPTQLVLSYWLITWRSSLGHVRHQICIDIYKLHWWPDIKTMWIAHCWKDERIKVFSWSCWQQYHNSSPVSLLW
jgi:hypothetical protein